MRQNQFEVFQLPGQGHLAIKTGFNWPAFFLTWIWAFHRRLWGAGFALLTVWCLLGAAIIGVFQTHPVAATLLGLAFHLTAGFRGNHWRSKSAEETGCRFRARVPGASASDAIARLIHHGDELPPEWRFRSASGGLRWVPHHFQQIAAIAWLTWKAAFRYRLFLVLLGLLLLAVVALPALIKDDGTASGFVQIMLTYTLASITALLGLATLWLACGTLARDIEECQMQVVAVKPVPRWRIWIGKWVGIMSLNAVLLLLAGGAVYSLLLWRAQQLPPDEQEKLRNEVLVARASVREPVEELSVADRERILQERLREISRTAPDQPPDLALMRQQIEEAYRSYQQLVNPGFVRIWRLDFGMAANRFQDDRLYIRTQFNAAQTNETGTYLGLWQIGPTNSATPWRQAMSLAADTYHEFEVPPGLIGDDGILTIQFINHNDTTLLFPLEEGMEVLYREGNFGLNYARGIAILFCWLGLLASLGLAAASRLSFPVAAFFSLGVLIVAFSTGTMNQVIQEGGILGINPDTGYILQPDLIDQIAVGIFQALLAVINLVRGFSPIDALSTGRSITWGELAAAISQIVLLLGGLFAAVGITLFNRRELATAQGTQ
ncbi:MAG TPA: DUF2628 domain-containing protein [Methylomirabilota bacterium]|nr:DUF2628 domain-containing protein [Methylomirabilota bacterium]